MMVDGSKEVSATYTVDNKDYNGRGWARITGVVPEHLRAWTSSSYADEGALTVEVCNATGDPEWAIADVTHEACARIAAYALTAYGVPLQRASHDNGTYGHLGHNEVQGMFGDSYSTACPMHVDIDRIIARATQLATGEWRRHVRRSRPNLLREVYNRSIHTDDRTKSVDPVQRDTFNLANWINDRRAQVDTQTRQPDPAGRRHRRRPRRVPRRRRLMLGVVSARRDSPTRWDRDRPT